MKVTTGKDYWVQRALRRHWLQGMSLQSGRVHEKELVLDETGVKMVRSTNN